MIVTRVLPCHRSSRLGILIPGDLSASRRKRDASFKEAQGLRAEKAFSLQLERQRPERRVWPRGTGPTHESAGLEPRSSWL